MKCRHLVRRLTTVKLHTVRSGHGKQRSNSSVLGVPWWVDTKLFSDDEKFLGNSLGSSRPHAKCDDCVDPRSHSDRKTDE